MPTSTSPYLVGNKLTAKIIRATFKAYLMKTPDGKTIWIRKGFKGAPNPTNWRAVDFDNTSTDQVFELSSWQMQNVEFLGQGESPSWQKRPEPAEGQAKPARTRRSRGTPVSSLPSISEPATSRTMTSEEYDRAFDAAYKTALHVYMDELPNAESEGVMDDFKNVSIAFENARLKIWQEIKLWASRRQSVITVSESDRYGRPNRVTLYLMNDPDTVTFPDPPYAPYSFDMKVHKAFIDKLKSLNVPGASTLEAMIIHGYSY